MFELHNTLQNSTWVEEDVVKKIRKYFEFNVNENNLTIFVGYS